jgi:hypothetical protein
MCDYSLETYKSRPAVKGEFYETRRFASGSIGFVVPQARDTGVCMACNTRLMLTGQNADLSSKIGASAEATFVRLDQGPYHDGVRFVDGTELTLQQLGTGVRATVIDSLVEPIWPVGDRIHVPASVLG